jgi:hypothetical protein
MKNVFLVIVLFALGFTNVNAQGIDVGIKGGLNFASISGDNTGDADTVTSFHFGAVAELSLTDKFSFQPELLYSGQGYSVDDFTVELNYINVPLMAKYYLTESLSLEAGPQLGFLISAKDESEDIKEFLNEVDFTANLGLGFKLSDTLNVAARYNLGLSDINNRQDFNDKYKNGVFQISVGYNFF